MFPLVFVTGLGIVSSVGKTITEFKHALKQGHNCIIKSQQYPMLSFPVLQGELQNFNFLQALENINGLPTELSNNIGDSIRRYPLVVETGLISALQAWVDSGLINNSIEPSRIGLIIAGQNTSSHYQYQLTAKFQQNPDYLTPAYTLHFLDSNLIGVISETLNIQGPGITVGAASASGNLGIIQGFQWLQQGIVDVCVIVGALADLSPLELQAFYNFGALGGRSFYEKPSHACRPFDKQHEGFIPGQASACIILENDKSVKSRQTHRYGKILSAVSFLDGNRLTDPSLTGEINVMQQALQQAKLQPSDISYINTHGTSTPLGDQIEAAAIQQVFAKGLDKIPLNATKSITGHCLWSAGVVETIATLLQMENNFLHPMTNLEESINNTCRWTGKTAETAHINFALNNSFGFSGINSSIVLARD